MSISAIAIAPVSAPQHVADLRPVADAAAIRRETDPALPVAPPPASGFHTMAFPPVTPPSPVTRAEVGRTLLAADGGADDRKLKPWGVAMLPDSEARDQAARQEQAKEQRAAREKVASDAATRNRPPSDTPAAATQAAASPPRTDASRAAPAPSAVVDRNASATDGDGPTLSPDTAEPSHTTPPRPADDAAQR
jgi:hypothetical protein